MTPLSAKLRALHGAATPGEWKAVVHDGICVSAQGRQIAWFDKDNYVADAVFVVAAVNALPLLLECIEAAEAMADVFSEIDESAIEGAALNAYRAARARLDEVK